MAESRNLALKRALDESGISQQKLADELGITRTAVNERLNDDKEIESINFIKAVSKLTGKHYSIFIEGESDRAFIEDLTPWLLKEDQSEYLKGKEIRPITVTVDRTGKELISYITVKAQAGYAKGYGDPKFMEKLPAYSLPGFNDNGTFRMFQVDGDSMLQLGGGGLKDGDVVIAQYVEDIFSLRDNMVYVIVHTGGVVVKRIINRLTTSDKALILKSDNKSGQHSNKLVHAAEIIEAWEYKAHISRQLNFATDLWELINELQAQNVILADRVDKMDSITRALKPKEGK